MKTVIIYESKHHGNTKKVCDELAKKCGVDLLSANNVSEAFDWSQYDLIGFASGIAFNKFYDGVTQIAAGVPEGKNVFFIYTCANNNKDFAQDIRLKVEKNGAKCVGTYGCRGFNTYGPLKLIGGMNKANPTSDELDAAVDFYMALCETID